jgi:hypothetical protein
VSTSQKILQCSGLMHIITKSDACFTAAAPGIRYTCSAASSAESECRVHLLKTLRFVQHDVSLTAAIDSSDPERRCIAAQLTAVTVTTRLVESIYGHSGGPWTIVHDYGCIT